MSHVERRRMLSYNECKYTIGGIRMDRITQSMVESFSVSQDLGITDPSLLFEYFVNYCCVNSVYGLNNFDLEEITTGHGTQGIDGIAIVVNQKLINSTDDIDMLIEMNQTISVKFVLIQTKTSESFKNAEIGNLFTYTKLYFSDDTSIFKTPEMQKFIELKDYIFSNGDKLKKNPELILYYVTLGTWVDRCRQREP